VTTPSATEVVLLTPEGRGAVASLLVAGPRATEAVSELFHPGSQKPLAEQPCGKIVWGRWQSRDSGEEVVVCRRTPERVEIHCHGGHVAAAAILDSLAARGCRVIGWQQWEYQSADDPLAAAAQIALAAAPTERTAAILWDQARGALRRALDEIAVRLRAGDTRTALACVDSLLEWSALGGHLVEPWRVVLAGRPNVGKSSLINALLGYPRAIVHDTPGTTRDVVTAATALDGWPVELSDTAGLHASSDALEAAGIQLAQSRLAAADLPVLVFDASSPWSDDDQGMLNQWPTGLLIHNKCDLSDSRTAVAARPAGLLTSATGGQGIDALQRDIARRLVPRSPATGQAVPFAVGQVELLEHVRAALLANEPQTALGFVTGMEGGAGGLR
jgi:tRNA modification GTPase